MFNFFGPKIIQSAIIGPLKQDKEFNRLWRSEPVAIPMFDKKEFIVTFSNYNPDDDKLFLRDADEALANFLKLDQNTKLAISGDVYSECQEVLSMLGPGDYDERLTTIKDPTQIWQFVNLSEIIVRRRSRRDKNIYIAVTGNCLWEEEHGFQLVFRRGLQLTRVSDNDGHITHADAFDVDDSEDALLSRFIS